MEDSVHENAFRSLLGKSDMDTATASLQRQSTEHLASSAAEEGGGLHLKKLRKRLRSNALDVESLSPRKAKRIVANREAAHRSRTKKVEWVREMENNVHRLQQENAALMNQLVAMQSRHTGLCSLLAQNLQTVTLVELLREKRSLAVSLESLKRDEEQQRSREAFLQEQCAQAQKRHID